MGWGSDIQIRTEKRHAIERLLGAQLTHLVE